MKHRWVKIWYAAFILIMLVSLIGCSDDNDDPSGAERSKIYCEDRKPLQTLYEAAADPGLSIVLEFAAQTLRNSQENFEHWVLTALWQDNHGDTLAEVTVPVEITASGIGVAALPPDFLDTVLEQVHTRYQAQQPEHVDEFLAEYTVNITVSRPARSASGSLPLVNIIGGETAASREWPWIGAIVQSGRDPRTGQYCGGTLVYPNWVVTAAHCVDREDTDVVLGTDNLLAPADQYERIPVVEKIVHPDYNPYTNEHDIALYRLAYPSSQETVAVDRASLAQGGKTAMVAGWGVTEPDGSLNSPQLLQVSVPIVSNEECRQSFGELGRLVQPGMFCAGYPQGGKDSCFGDSGGPAMVDGVLSGIVSWGAELCAQPGEFGVYTRVSDYVDWMTTIICNYDPSALIGGVHVRSSVHDLLRQLHLTWHPADPPPKGLSIRLRIQ